MNGYERVRKALHFEPADRVAIIPELIQHNLEVAGMPHSAFSSDPTVMTKVILEGLKAYETDAVYVSSDNYLIVEAMGGEVKLPYDDPPVLLHTAASTIEEAVQLKPLDVTKGRIPVILEATRMLREELKDEIFVKTCIDSAPFSAAAALLGPQEFMINLFDEPELCHELLEIGLESAIRYGSGGARPGLRRLGLCPDQPRDVQGICPALCCTGNPDLKRENRLTGFLSRVRQHKAHSGPDGGDGSRLH